MSIIHDIVSQIVRFQEEHGGESPREHWIDEATWERACDEADAVLAGSRSKYRTRLREKRIVFGVPVRVWDAEHA